MVPQLRAIDSCTLPDPQREPVAIRRLGLVELLAKSVDLPGLSWIDVESLGGRGLLEVYRTEGCQVGALLCLVRGGNAEVRGVDLQSQCGGFDHVAQAAEAPGRRAGVIGFGHHRRSVNASVWGRSLSRGRLEMDQTVAQDFNEQVTLRVDELGSFIRQRRWG